MVGSVVPNVQDFEKNNGAKGKDNPRLAVLALPFPRANSIMPTIE